MISVILETFFSVFDCVLCVFFITKFNHASLKNKFTLPTLILITAIQLISDRVLTSYSLLNTFILLAITIIYAILISNRHFFQAILSACIYKIVLILLSTLLAFSLNLFLDEFDKLLYGADNTARYLYAITHKVLLLAVLLLILKFSKSKNRGSVINAILTFSFSVITVIGISISISIVSAVPNAPIKTQLLVLSLIFLLLNFFLYFLINQVNNLQKRNYDLQLLSEKTKYEEHRYNEALMFWNSAEKIRHDMKNHMVVISGLLENKDIDGSITYVNQLLDQVNKGKRFKRSGNAVLDYLLESKLSTLENTEIIIVGSVAWLSNIKDTDLASLIGNILDNAVEAEEKVSDKRIELLFNHQNSNMIIICKNNIEQSVLKNNKSLRSTKVSDHAHGFGHQIVEDIVKKYEGLISYFEENNMFGVEIIFPMCDLVNESVPQHCTPQKNI